MAYSADTFVADEQPTTAKWNKLWTNDASFNDGTGIGDNVIGSRQIQLANDADLYALNASASEKSILRLDSDNYLRLGQIPRQNDNSNSIGNTTEENVLMQYGYGQLLGNNTNNVTETVTFPATYTSAPIVFVSLLGAKATPAATDITGIGITLDGGQGYGVAADDITTSSFTLSYMRVNSTIANTVYYCYAWMAIGPKT